MTLAAFEPASGKRLGEVVRDDVAAERLVGNIALVSNFAAGGPAPGQAVAKKAATGTDSFGMFWFEDWRVGGSKVEVHDDRTFGPIPVFSVHAQPRGPQDHGADAPIGEQDSRAVKLQVRKGEGWAEIGESSIHPEARTATFRVEGWDDRRDVPYFYCNRFNDDLFVQLESICDRRWETHSSLHTSDRSSIPRYAAALA